MRYLEAVEAAFQAKLQADPGFGGLITKNPAHPLWRVLHGPRLTYELAELAEWVDLPKHLPKRKPGQVGVGRNITLFDWLRHYAYRHIRHYKHEVRNFVVWQSHLNAKALERNGEFRVPLDPREVWHIAKSVSKWTWRRFDLAASDARFSATQAARGRLSGKARAAASENKRASARLMAARGMSQQAIARELGVPRSTVQLWLNGGASEP
jgi:DNA-directed RNA polymerase specialized sigma24 family protein